MPRHLHSALARLQQALVFWVLSCVLGWLAVWWGRAPALAAAGALVLAFSHAWVLGAEFLLLRAVARTDPAPRASAAALLRAWHNETLQGFRVFGWRQPFAWREVPDRLEGAGVRGRHGVVLVHGFVCNRGFWTPWLQRLQATRRAFVAVNLEPVFTGIDQYVPTLDEAVRQVREATGLPPVLVCHSMGGLVARAWLRARMTAAPGAAPWVQAVPGLSAQDLVAHVVTLGSPHAGTWLARFSHLPNGRQMRQDSPWLAQLRQAWTPALASRFTCWYSNADNIVMPPSTATLPGADNRLMPGAAHVDLAFRPEVMEATFALLDDLSAKPIPATGEPARTAA